ncbi:MAG: GTP 3',8-cyclase MoaA [Candidatus Omnitrophota bacterium]
MENAIDYLRLSLTDRCNLNCLYCTPLERERFLRREELLSYEEIVRAVATFVRAGVRKLRLTGGEPLIKKDIVGLIKMLKKIDGLEEISMTTNGVYLAALAFSLKEAGLNRINISINSLKKERFKTITGFDHFDEVWAGINAARKAGLNPVKLNVILMKGINDDEIPDFVRLAIEQHLIVRFIEYFPVNRRSYRLGDALIKSEEVKEKTTRHFGSIQSICPVVGNGPARYYKLQNSEGIIGFISGSSTNFCDHCNRVRMDCAGRICPCLFSGPTHDIRPLIRGLRSEVELLEYITGVFKIKSGFRKDFSSNCQLEMSSIGG